MHEEGLQRVQMQVEAETEPIKRSCLERKLQVFTLEDE